MLYADVEHIAREACAELGIDLDQIMPYDPEPGLGNGGLGRLAACFLTLWRPFDIPAVGYGIATNSAFSSDLPRWLAS